ncbi:PRC-barrel domain containing protein [Dactylosporangium aurantiacum]|uniref:PRC-barrel domain containing protein n=1 Tax=Dactylosporangium aurantiacum TaxID=35754 RepID=A0A9Q9MJ37_9ACTN|nr:PRC-barrel domain containing protein [Dactylosporangium aurantiacum]MDG6110312.1 PRC-barrel domain containing protein [Dactylosporangium aurantiacum]UWZ58569.1 PRC-barrel domain containing protein [Dactylosporangium aurantiacum]
MFRNPYDVWQWRTGIATAVTTGTQNLAGFEVRATDGSVGTVAEDGDQLGTTCLVVDNGSWMPSRRMMLPAGTVEDVDCAAGIIRLDRTGSQLRDSPAYDPESFGRPHYYDVVAHYFADTYQDA